MITRNNAQCYYLYRDEKMGFEYDLAGAFAKRLGVALKVHVAARWEGMIPALLDGSGQLIAASYTSTAKRRRKVNFSDGYLAVRQHIIVERGNPSIREPGDLAGKVVHVRRGTSYQDRLEALQRQGVPLKIVLHDDLPTEDLIRMVARGEIEVTVADSNIALRARRYYPQVVIGAPIGDEEYLGWALHPEACELLQAVNRFLRESKADGTFAAIYNKYYRDVESFDYVDLKKFHHRIKTRLPRYFPIIQAAAERHRFDWRLIAAQIYKESHFNPAARSHAGAYGLMQLTQATAEALGVERILDARENIDAGVKHLRYLYDHYAELSGSDRLFVALAAYNVGMGHVWDARRLARRLRFNPDSWRGIQKTLPLLQQRKYYQYARYGYCRGSEPVEYVRQILIYYDILKYQGIQYST